VERTRDGGRREGREGKRKESSNRERRVRVKGRREKWVEDGYGERRKRRR
jgi:hypothetical protein